jgi:pimeloyl-ACP methyl ester carboxylesterase
MGGIVSLFVAVEEPRVDRLVIGGIGGAIARGRIPRAPVAAALRAEDPSNITDPAGRAFRAFAERSGNDLLALAAQAERAFDAIPALDRISVPTLLVVGDRDPLARRPEILAGAITGARLTVVPGDHLGAVGEPAFGEAILAFLEEAA